MTPHRRTEPGGSQRGRPLSLVLALVLTTAVAPGWAPTTATAQEPASWGTGDPLFHTFSIVAIDPATGESGVAVTTRVACVGNGVPWVRAGVGAVATQSYTRTEYGYELLDLIEAGVAPEEAMRRTTEADEGRDGRQVGVIGIDGRSAQYTGPGAFDWAGHRAGLNYATQGNLLVGPEVLEAVATTFEASEGSERHLADRLIEALAAGQAVGGDAREGRHQSAAVVVADPREGVSRRPDGITAHIHVCEHPTPVAELRRIYATVSETLGYRTLSQPSGTDVIQLKLILHALGYYLPELEELDLRADGISVYDTEAVAAVEAFREAMGLSTARLGSPAGLVEARTVELLWAELEAAGRAEEVREIVRRLTQVRR